MVSLLHLALLACSSLSRPFPPSVTSPAADLLTASGRPLDREVLEDFVEAERGRLHVAGVALAVVNGGEVVATASLGEADHGRGTPVRAGTLFEAASITKPVFAYAVLRFVDRGELDLDRPLHELLPHPDLAHDPRAAAITARMVLAHTTGLPNWRRGRLELLFAPGTDFEYSGEAYVYLGRVLEHLAGEDLEAILRREVFEPLGMRDSTMRWDDALEADKARAHVNGDVPLQTVWRPRAAVPASSLHTTAADLGRFLSAILRREGLSPAAFEELLSVQSRPPVDDPKQNANDSLRWTLGWVREPGPYGTRFHHGGTNLGFQGAVEVVPEAGFGYVVLTNSDRGERLVERVAALLSTGSPPPLPADASRDHVVGFDDPGWTIDGAARIGREGERSTLTALDTVELTLGDFAPQDVQIDVDVAVDTAFGFAGVTFRGRADGSYEQVYLRAHESGESNALQYDAVFHGAQSWQLYPGFNFHRTAYFRHREWMHLRLAVFDDWMEVFLDDMDTLALHVFDLKHAPAPGTIGLWGTEGTRFANLSVTPLDSYAFTYPRQPLPPLPPGFVACWEVSSPFPQEALAGDVLPEDLVAQLEWTKVESEFSGVVNLARRSGLAEGDTALARFTVVAAAPRHVRVDFGYSDAARVYIDDTLAYSGRNGLGERDERAAGYVGLFDSLGVPLRAGRTCVTFAITESEGGWGVLARLADTEGLTLEPALLEEEDGTGDSEGD